MTQAPPADRQPLRILAFGVEKKELRSPPYGIETRAYTIQFEPFDTTVRFQDFDGVIVFQGIFESFEEKRGFQGSYVHHEYLADDLDRRVKELRLLFDKGGFACFLLCQRFIDEGAQRDTHLTDLTKYWLNVDNLRRENLPRRATNVASLMSELRPFMDLFGAASTLFSYPGGNLILRPIAKVGGLIAGMVLWKKLYCIPSLLPERDPQSVAEYFTLLADGLVSVVQKTALELPDWANHYKFTRERLAVERIDALNKETLTLETEVSSFQAFKRVLISEGHDLVEAVKLCFEQGFGFKVDSTDEFKEDMKILGEGGKPIIFVEIKGTNGGVKREHVNQADSHRERAGLPPSFPSILVINTGIKKARSIEDKDEAVASEQVAHAHNHDVLILRTLDLLRLLGLYKDGRVTTDEVMRLLTARGWLRVSDDAWSLVER